MEECVVGYWLKEQSQLNKDKIAVATDEQSLTFSELYEKAYDLARYIQSLHKKRVGLFIKNDLDSVILIHACWIAQIEIAMLNTRLTEQEMRNQMKSVRVDTILHTMPLTMEDFKLYNIEGLRNLAPQQLQSKQFNLEDIASIMFTSGTTGPQKAVPQTFHNHLASATGCKQSLGFDQHTKWLSVLPIYHISGLSVILRSVIEGFTVRLVGKFNTNKMLHIIKDENMTHVSLVPQTLKWLMDGGLTQPFSIEKILLGGAKLSSNLIEQALANQLPIYNSFGMTETCSQFLTASPEMLAQKHDTVGKPSDNVKVKIKNLNQDGHGELLIKGENVMNGYLYPENLTKTFEDGFFKTGDIAEIDEEGFVMVYDRRKDLIISGGENIYPYQIETVAKQFNEISDAVCVGVADDTWGQIPVLYFVSENEVNREELLNHFQQNLAKYKVPKAFYQVENLPYTSTGKLQRSKVSYEGNQL